MNEQAPPSHLQGNLISTQSGSGTLQDASLLKRAEKINRALFAISNAVNTTMDLNHLYQSIHHSLASIIDVTNFFIAIVDSKERTLYFPYHIDTVDEDFAPITDFDADDSLTGLVVSRQQPILLRQAEIEARNDQNGIWGPTPLIWLGVPLVIKKTVIGVMAIQSYSDPCLYTEQDLQVLSAVSHQTAIAIDRKRSHDELKKSEQRYRQLFDQSNDAILIHRNGRIIDVNQRACEMLETDADRLKSMTIVQIEGNSDPQGTLQRYANVGSGRPMCWESEWKQSGGTVIQVEISSRLADRRKGIIQSIGRDITDRKHLEAQLQQSKKMEAIGLLAGGVAHDLNNVLSGIVSYPDLILMDLPQNSPLRDKIQTVRRSGKKAADIVQDLLTLARRGVITRKAVNLNTTISEYLTSPEHEKLLANHPDVSVQTDLLQGLPCIEGASIQLRKVVMNLVSNAAEALPSGGTITLTTRVQQVDLPIKGYMEIRPGRFVVLAVADNGIGIEKEDLDRIFEPFYTKKTMGRSGTGLGMAVVWGTIHDHQGRIDIQSASGEGTIFTLYFPTTDKMPDRENQTIPVEIYRGHRETVLVVDDLEDQRTIACHMLGKLNYNAVAVPSGEAAVAYLTTHSADLIILDMIMAPGIDGLQTYRRIRALRPNQKVIIASGFSETKRVKEAQALGACDYIRKPYSLEKIGLTVQKALAI